MVVHAQMMDRAMAALTGLAVGDALGMPSQTMTRPDIAAAYGRITDFIAPIADHPISHGLRAASVTDDTEQTLLLANHLIHLQGRMDDQVWAQALIDWEKDVRERGLRDLLGPSTKQALDALLSGVPATMAGCRGTTNGAAMRIAPVAIATPSGDADALVARVAEACRVTHNTREAIAAAAAVAMVISRGIDGANFATALPDAYSGHLQCGGHQDAQTAHQGRRDLDLYQLDLSVHRRQRAVRPAVRHRQDGLRTADR